MKKLLVKYRKKSFPQLTPLTEAISTQGFITLSFSYFQTRSEYADRVKILDCILDGKYKNDEERMGKCVAIVEYDETKISAESLAFDLSHDFADHAVKLLDRDESYTFMTSFTTCPENNRVFTITEQVTLPNGEIIPEYTLNLN